MDKEDLQNKVHLEAANGRPSSVEKSLPAPESLETCHYNMTPRRRLRMLTIGGSDSGGGAGIQGDLKTFAAYGAYGMSAITAVTAQNTCEVRALQEMSAEIVTAQIDAVFQDIGVDGIKVGMLANSSIVHAVADKLRAYLAVGVGSSAMRAPIVIDPVMFAKSGASLLDDDAIEVMAAELLPLGTVVTPNLRELERLTGLPVVTEEDQHRAAVALAAGGITVLAKGGHAGVLRARKGSSSPGEQYPVIDLLLAAGRCYRFIHPRIDTRSTHGTGCTLSSAIAVSLAAGKDLPDAVRAAISYLQGAIAIAYPLGDGCGPVDHFYRMECRGEA